MRGMFAAMLLLLVSTAATAGVDEIFREGETLDYNLQWTRISGGSASKLAASGTDACMRAAIA